MISLHDGFDGCGSSHDAPVFSTKKMVINSWIQEVQEVAADSLIIVVPQTIDLKSRFLD